MKKAYLATAILISAALAFSCSKKNTQIDTVMHFMAGDVFILNSGSKAPAKQGEIIVQGMKIITGKNSFADIRMGDNSIRILENSEVSMAELLNNPTAGEFKSDMKLESGKVYSSLPGKLMKGNAYAVKTQTIVAAVRGTEFIVETKSGRDRIACTSGMVAVKSSVTGKEVEVNEGEQVTAVDGKLSDPEKISSDLLSEIASIRSDLSDGAPAKDEIKPVPRGMEPDRFSPEKKLNLMK